MSDAVQTFIAHGLKTRFEDVSPAAVQAGKTFLLDTIGVGVAGAAVAQTAQIRQAAASWGGGACAHLLGPGQGTTSVANAAFVNGFQIHCQEFDCVHEPAVVHPLATILATLLAGVEGETSAVSGAEFITAMAVGVDMAAGLGVAAKSPLKFFRPATAGIFGATLGLSSLRGFDQETTNIALGYALSFCSGSMQAHVEGKPALPVQIGNAARGAVMAADLAANGMDGPRDVLDGPFGYTALIEDEMDFEPVLETLGKTWRIAEVSHKPFPTGRAAQGGIVLMQNLRAQGVTVDNIEHIKLSAPPLIKRLVGRPIQQGMAANYARLCFGYSGAVALARGHVGLADFADAALSDPEILALGNRISVVENAETDPAAFAPQHAVATLKSGETVMAAIDQLYGSPADPMSHAAHLEKFRACLAFGFGSAQDKRAARMIALTDTIETLTDMRELIRLAAGYEA